VWSDSDVLDMSASRTMNTLSHGLRGSMAAVAGVALVAACGGSTVASPLEDSGQTAHDTGSSDASHHQDAPTTADAAGDRNVASACEGRAGAPEMRLGAGVT
jgi:hypothetical protein